MATIKYWDGSAWQYAVVGKQGPAGPTGPTGPAGSASLQRFRFVATGGETSLSGTDANGNTLAYTPGLEEVFLNGAALVRGQDYTATNGTSITGLTALIATDVVEILAWGVFNVANTISNTLIDAKGDILAGSAADTVSRLAVGADNTVLTADSSTATGLKWAAASAGGMTQLATGTLSGSTVNLTSISGSYKDLQLVIENPKINSGSGNLQLRVNSQANLYSWFWADNGGYGIDTNWPEFWLTGTTAGSNKLTTANNYIGVIVTIPNYASTIAHKGIISQGADDPSNNGAYTRQGSVYGLATSAITSVQIIASTSTFSGGTYTLYGVS